MLPVDPKCARRRFRIPKEQITYVRHIVEGYDNLAVVSSRPGRAEMEWLIPLDLVPQADALAAALGDEVGLVLLPGE